MTNRVRGCATHPTCGGTNFKTDVGCVQYARTRFLLFKPLFQTFRQPQTFSENLLVQRPSEIQFSDGLIVYSLKI